MQTRFYRMASLGAFVSAVSVFGAEPSRLVLKCSSSDSKVVAKLTQEGDRFILEEQNTRVPFKVMGIAHLEMKGGILAGVDSSIGLVNADQPGASYMNVEVKQGSSKTRKVEYVVSMKSRQMKCSEGPAIGSLDRSAALAGEIASDALREWWDSSLALSCRKSDGSAVRVRAFHGGYGQSDVQVVTSPNFADMYQLGTWEETADGIVYRYHPGQIPLPGSPTIPMEFNLSLKPADEVYGASFKIGDVETELSCQKRWALNAITEAMSEKRAEPKSLPSPVGQLADLDPSFCTEGGYERAFQKISPYSALVMNIPGVVGMSYGMAQSTEHPSGKKCVVFEISLKTAQDLEEAQARLGGTFLGLWIKYQVTGVFRAN